jgi:hypothetical protein
MIYKKEERREGNSCKNCVYWRKVQSLSNIKGLCERYPPQVSGLMVNHDNWCGEHLHNTKG